MKKKISVGIQRRTIKNEKVKLNVQSSKNKLYVHKKSFYIQENCRHFILSNTVEGIICTLLRKESNSMHVIS